jgi:tetratricopeptide (TPR) repeat protein
MSRKKVSRARKRDLEQPDEFLSITAKLIQQINRYRTPLAIVVVVVFVSLAAFSAIRFFAAQAENRAFHRLSVNLQTYQEAGGNNAPKEALEKVKQPFESLLADDGQREGGKLARLIYADMHYRAGNLDEAIANYEKAVQLLPPAQFAHASALSGLGYAYIEAGRNDDAIRCFEEITNGAHSALGADALYQLGRLYGQKGQTAKQQAAYRRLLDEAPTFVYADLIKRQTEG